MKDKEINDEQSKEKFNNQISILDKTLIDLRNTSFLEDHDINDVLFDLCDKKSIDILATLTSKKSKREEKLSVSNHFNIPTGEVL